MEKEKRENEKGGLKDGEIPSYMSRVEKVELCRVPEVRRQIKLLQTVS